MHNPLNLLDLNAFWKSVMKEQVETAVERVYSRVSI